MRVRVLIVAMFVLAPGVIAAKGVSLLSRWSTSSCLPNNARAEALSAWLRTAFSSSDSSWVEWRDGNAAPVLAPQDIALRSDSTSCARGGVAITGAFPGYPAPVGVHVVRVGQYGYAITSDSLRSVNSVLVMTDTAFAVRFVQFWQDYSSPNNP